MTRKQRRLTLVLVGLALIAGVVAIALSVLNPVYFYGPTDIASSPPAAGERFRLGGLVAEGSVEHGEDLQIAFTVTDGVHTVPVSYRGLTPDLFREGQGVVAEGAFDEAGTYVADTLLAKHDENYMPAEVAAALKEAGTWKEPGTEGSYE